MKGIEGGEDTEADRERAQEERQIRGGKERGNQRKRELGKKTVIERGVSVRLQQRRTGEREEEKVMVLVVVGCSH